MRIVAERAFALLLGVLVLSPASTAQAHPPVIDPIVPTIPDSHLTIALKPVMTGLVQPTAGAVAPGDPEHLYIADQVGTVWALDISRHAHINDAKLFLDIRDQLVTLGLGASKYDERGLLGIAFHPNFRRNHLFYTFSSQPATRPATFNTLPPDIAPNCQSVLQEWRVTEMDDDTMVVQPGSARVLMVINKPQFNHNGGALLFGPDRMLYVAVGDGGGSNDSGVGHAAAGNAQSLVDGNVLGKILRIDPLGHDSANGQYGIPRDNPFSDRWMPLAGPHEIFAYGFRNPWRMSFDAETGALYAGDVGQNDLEEVDIVRRGKNYGWPVKEGTFLFDGFLAGRGGTGYVWQNSPGAPAGIVDPIAQYDHGDGQVPPLHSGVHVRQAVIGGFVYRGDRVDALQGRYVFGDYGSATSPIEGNLYVLRGRDRKLETLNVEGRSSLGLAVLAFAQSRDGELFLLASQTGTVLGTTGVVLRIVEAKGDDGRDGHHERDRDDDDSHSHHYD
jgi:glucose/arabinose dehydrogenase